MLQTFINWDDPEISKALLAEATTPGSASQIADKISKLAGRAVTRNAVLGRLHRLKLSTGYVRQPRPPGTVYSRRRQRPKQENLAPRPQRERQLPVFDGLCGDNPNILIPISQRCTLDQLTQETCRWPIGDPRTDLFFCGAKVADDGAPYCQCHNRIAYIHSRPGNFFRLPR